jgi:hypothetical protein
VAPQGVAEAAAKPGAVAEAAKPGVVGAAVAEAEAALSGRVRAAPGSASRARRRARGWPERSEER